MNQTDKKYFKGGTFFNRYKITGKLTTQSPLHIGDGEMISDAQRIRRTEGMKKDPEFSTVMTDFSGRAYIPGSTIKGNLRAWLEQIFSHQDFNLAVTNTEQRAGELQEKMQGGSKAEIIAEIRSTLKPSEFIFGSSVSEGKLEFWDAPMSTPPAINSSHTAAYNGYDPKRGTILLKSVAIDPVSGTAAKNKLYNYEAVPAGACFQLTIAGQNLADDELGMLLFVLEGFNSMIYPVTLGAMGGIGFGHFKFKIDQVHYLDKTNFKSWIKEAVQTGHAGYSSIPALSDEARKNRIQNFRNTFSANLA